MKVHRVTPLEDARRAAGLTAQQLADKAGVSYATVLEAEKGGSPRRATMVVLAMAVCLPVNELWSARREAA